MRSASRDASFHGIGFAVIGFGSGETSFNGTLTRFDTARDHARTESAVALAVFLSAAGTSGTASRTDAVRSTRSSSEIFEESSPASSDTVRHISIILFANDSSLSLSSRSCGNAHAITTVAAGAATVHTTSPAHDTVLNAHALASDFACSAVSSHVTAHLAAQAIVATHSHVFFTDFQNHTASYFAVDQSFSSCFFWNSAVHFAASAIFSIVSFGFDA